MSTEIKSRSPDYSLTRFAGPNGRAMLQVTAYRQPEHGNFIHLSQDAASKLISDLYDFVNSDPRQ